MKRIIPPKLRAGDTICIIAPSKSLLTITKPQRKASVKRLNNIGLNVIYGKHAEERDEFDSSPVASRITDLHRAFADKKVKGIIAAAGGFNSNQLLRHIDWQLIKENPKIFCGYSDITTLLTAIYTKTGLITYSGPNFSSFGDPVHGDYTISYFIKCLMEDMPFVVNQADTWSNSKWEDKWHVRANEGLWVMQDGECQGLALGENLVTFNFLKGTEYFPNIENSILFLEDDFNNKPHDFDEHLQSLIIDRRFKKIKGLVFGRFQEQSKITREVLHDIVSTKSELHGMPILANADFGHTEPKFTFPFGGKVKITASKHASLIQILDH